MIWPTTTLALYIHIYVHSGKLRSRRIGSWIHSYNAKSVLKKYSKLKKTLKPTRYNTCVVVVNGAVVGLVPGLKYSFLPTDIR
jgi:hypothetical protein